ncbi:hypothetical protein BY996DRAFT_6520849 [Phakopsora pachyrhizi]|nr:hypothetical protein BY996DRAFT_6520849 [Phakopsora pachyrhizi]
MSKRPLPPDKWHLKIISKLFEKIDPFGFNFSSRFGQSLKSGQDSSSSTGKEPIKTVDLSDQQIDRKPLGSTIFRRIAQNRQDQLQDLQNMEEQIRLDQNRKATQDQVWSSVSQLQVQTHSGPLTPASSRVVRTSRVPPNSFMIRPILASDFERAYRKLQSLLNAAGLKREIYLNKRYEKPYLKRRRLRSERHRRRFAIEVQRRVQIISIMKLKGM